MQSETILVGAQLVCLDRIKTIDAYQRTSSVWSDICTCAPCRNFVAQRSTAFSPLFLRLLDQLGIDWQKDSEIYGCYPMQSGLRHYGGWFFFCGELLDHNGKEAELDGVCFHVRGPRDMPKPAEVFEPNPLALEFTIYVPWVLIGENPDELYGPPLNDRKGTRDD